MKDLCLFRALGALEIPGRVVDTQLPFAEVLPYARRGLSHAHSHNSVEEDVFEILTVFLPFPSSHSSGLCILRCGVGRGCGLKAAQADMGGDVGN